MNQSKLESDVIDLYKDGWGCCEGSGWRVIE